MKLRRTKTMILVAATLAIGSLVVAGCGQDIFPTSATATSPSVSAVMTSSSTTVSSMGPLSTTDSASPSQMAIAEVFAQLATHLTPLPIFVPTDVPPEAALAEKWLPVIGSKDPAAYAGSPRANPYIVGSGSDAEVQVVLSIGEGWLVVVENFHGDVGDVAATPVGAVDGLPASLYEMNDGELVQWSKDGMWYGVFGRGVSRATLLAVALNMVQASAESV